LLDTVNEVLREAPATESAAYHSSLDKDSSRDEKLAGATNGGQISSAYSILVVDDDDAIRELNMDVLADSGYEVAGAKNGAAGWQAIQNNDYDLIVTDNKMPKMTGIEMIGKLRSAGMTVPVIMATGILPTQEFIRSPWLKPDAALERPFSSDDLLAAVKSTLRRDDGNPEGLATLLPKYL
jgi:DNA-binding response OmpR family regulator